MTLSPPAIQSMRAIEAWVGLIDAEMAGLRRTAFKATRPTLGGIAGSLPTAGPGPALSLPAACLTLKSGIDFAQGPIQASDSPVHLALDGPGFFPVVPGHTDGPLCFTRDGEFRLVPDPNGGYCLMNGLGMRLYIPPPRSVLARVGSPDPAQFDPGQLFNGATHEPLQIARFTAPEESLRYSCYGATVFLPAPGAGTPSYHPLDAADGRAFPGLPTRLHSRALEGSNADAGRLIPDLSLAQKLFAALAQLVAADERRFQTLVDELR